MKPARVLFLSAAVFLFHAELRGLEQTGPLSFAAAADLAVAASYDLKGEYAVKAMREGAWVLGRRAYLPGLTLGVSEDDRLAETGADSFIKSYTLGLDQLIWDGGKLLLNRRLERMDLNLAGAKLERMASEIREAALSAYRQVISARAVLEIREAAGETLAEQRDLLRKEVEMGLAIPADLAGADITLEESRIELRSMHIDLKETERQFAELLGLEELPPLSEEVDTERSSVLPSAGIARSMTEARNPDLAEERSLIMKRQGELKYAALSWIPTIRLTGGFGVNGRRYPLTRHTWTVGINIDFSSPYIANTISGSAGWEPPYDRTARFQNSMSPLPDPAAGFTKNQAELALALERKKYDLNIERLGRAAETAVEKCRMADQKRALALEAGSLARERYRLAELKRELGLLTRLELMEEKIECSQKEIAAVEAAVILLEAERELERLMDLRPGELKLLAGRGGGS